MVERFKDPSYQGKVDWKLFEGKADIKRKSGYSRCPSCNSDVPKGEIFPSGETCVSEKTFLKMFQVFKENGAYFEMLKREFVKYPLTYKIDEITLKPIDGVATYINFEVCRKCLEKIGKRHKFSKWKEKSAFINQV